MYGMTVRKPAERNPHSDMQIMQITIPARMTVACCLSSLVGILLMAVTGYRLLMALLIILLFICLIDVPLVLRRRMSVETASLIPMLFLCFVYTPVSWFTFDGLLGCTPYLSILFATMIIFTYYRRIQLILLPIYALLLAGLLTYWFVTSPVPKDSVQVINILVAYVVAFSVTVSIAVNVKNKNLEINRHITDLSLHDGLTNLLNRRAVEDVLAGSERAFQAARTDYALVIMDVDRFKSINDLYGHPIGDAVLRTLAQCIRRMIRTEDSAFRYGGDEFLLLLANVDDAASAHILERIEAALRNEHGYAFSITVSAGCAMRSECATVQETLALADRRMYDTKEARRAEVQENS